MGNSSWKKTSCLGPISTHEITFKMKTYFPISVFVAVIFAGAVSTIHPDRNGVYTIDDMFIDENQYQETILGYEHTSGSSSFPNSGITSDKYRWRNGLLPYKLDPEFSANQKRIIRNAIAHFNHQVNQLGNPFLPCIYVREATSDDNDYAFIKKGSDCSSSVGKRGGRQNITLGTGCHSQRTVIHEIVHALGYYHEQSRPDRDDYIKINLDNVKENKTHNFIKHGDTLTYDIPHDGKSIMHYQSRSFSKNGDPTITSKIPDVRTSQLGASNELTNMDIQKLRKMYKCESKVYPQPTCPTDGCPTEDVEVLESVGRDNKICIFRCDYVTEGDYRRARDGTGYECFDKDASVQQYNYCCRSRSIPGGIPQCH